MPTSTHIIYAINMLLWYIIYWALLKLWQAPPRSETSIVIALRSETSKTSMSWSNFWLLTFL